MMNRQDIINALRVFPYDCSAYWVVAGGAMVLHGVREETGDIDLGCSEALADRLEADGFLYQRRADGSRWFKYGERIEIFEKWMYDRTETVEGVRVISIDGLIQMKQALGRDKDLHDIAFCGRFKAGKESIWRNRSFKSQSEARVRRVHSPTRRSKSGMKSGLQRCSIRNGARPKSRLTSSERKYKTRAQSERSGLRFVVPDP